MTSSTRINVLQCLGRPRFVPLLAIATACAVDPQVPHEGTDVSTVSESVASLEIPTQQYRALQQVSVGLEELLVSVERSERQLDPELRVIWAEMERAGLYSQPLVATEDNGTGFVRVAQASMQDFVSNVDTAMPLVAAMRHRDGLSAPVQAAFDRLSASMQALAGADVTDDNGEKARHHYYCVLNFLDLHTECISLGNVFEAWAKTKCYSILVSTWGLTAANVSRECP